MTWRSVAASSVGTSHAATGSDCQDSCLAHVELGFGGIPFLMMFVADGAGSAEHGGLGAELAVEAAANFTLKHCAESELALNDAWAVECIQAVRERIYSAADESGAKAREYACTFLAVVASPFSALLMQIGDGGIVIDFGNGPEVPITPMVGEYANMTSFVTDENAIDILAVTAFQGRAEKVAVFSDGIQRLALNMADNTAHWPFFAPLFNVLASSSEEQEDQLQTALAKFLDSEAVNERTDDDKTLALAQWVS